MTEPISNQSTIPTRAIQTSSSSNRPGRAPFDLLYQERLSAAADRRPTPRHESDRGSDRADRQGTQESRESRESRESVRTGTERSRPDGDEQPEVELVPLAPEIVRSEPQPVTVPSLGTESTGTGAERSEPPPTPTGQPAPTLPAGDEGTPADGVRPATTPQLPVAPPLGGLPPATPTDPNPTGMPVNEGADAGPKTPEPGAPVTAGARKTPPTLEAIRTLPVPEAPDSGQAAEAPRSAPANGAQQSAPAEPGQARAAPGAPVPEAKEPNLPAVLSKTEGAVPSDPRETRPHTGRATAESATAAPATGLRLDGADRIVIPNGPPSAPRAAVREATLTNQRLQTSPGGTPQEAGATESTDSRGAPDQSEAEQQSSDQRADLPAGPRRGLPGLVPGQIVSQTNTGEMAGSHTATGLNSRSAVSPPPGGGLPAPGVVGVDATGLVGPVGPGRSLSGAARSTAAARATTARQILAQVRLVARPGLRQLTLQLEPAELGSLRLKFELKGEQLRVRVTASTPEVVSALRGDLSSFASTLRESGIDLTSLDIELDQSSDGAESRADSSRERPGSSDDSAAEPNPVQPERPADPQTLQHQGVIDVVA